MVKCYTGKFSKDQKIDFTIFGSLTFINKCLISKGNNHVF